MKQKTKQPDTCIICGSMSLRLLKDRATSDPILSPEGMKIYKCERCKGFSNEYPIDNMGSKKIIKADDIGGTSLRGHIECSYADIVAVFGEPSEGTDKTDAEWAVEFPCFTVATIYNWKNGVNYCGAYGTPVEQITQWNIGGYLRANSVELVKKALDK